MLGAQGWPLIKGRVVRASVLVFWALVVVVSSTQYKNPWIYPILDHGYVTALTDGNISVFEGKGQVESAFLDAVDISEIAGDSKYRVLNAYKKGTVFRVVGIYADMGDFYQRVGLVLTDGKNEFQVTESDWTEKPPDLVVRDKPSKVDMLFAQKVKPSKTVQAPWAKKLGQLMLWPVGPMLALAMLMPSSKP